MRSFKVFFAISVCVATLSMPLLQYESLAACTSPAKIDGYSYTPTSIQEAYNYARDTLQLTDFTLRLAGEIIIEDLVLDNGNVILDGGYDCSFTTKTGSPTGLFGTITIGGSGSANFAGDVGVVSTDQCSFDPDGDGYFSGPCAPTPLDCNENDPNVNPGAVEICDGIDNNCDGQIDEGAIPIDADGDGYYAVGSCGDSPYTDDCNDTDMNINPGALDIPYDGIDQDCDGADLTYPEGEPDGACSFCHGDGTGFGSLHAPTIPPDATCAGCHAPFAGPAGNILPAHYGRTVVTPDNGMISGETIDCKSCHDQVDFFHNFGANLVWPKAKVIRDAGQVVTCDACHEDRATGHETTAAHDNRVIDSGCGVCHTSDTTATGVPGTGTLASQTDVDLLHRSDCTLCHDYTGMLLNAAIVRDVIAQGVSGTPVSCLDCHTDKGSGHGDREHTVAVGPGDLSYDAPGQLCTECHVVATWEEIEGVEHNVDTNGAGSCATCHNSPRQDVRDAITLGANPTNCLACHPDKYLTVHGNPDHVLLGYVLGGTTTCLDCHDTGAVVNGTVETTHSNQCSLCHTGSIPELQPGLPVGGGICTDCHTNSWENTHISNPPSHASLVQVGMTGCADCHDNTLISTENRTHDSCSSCHDSTGGTISRADGETFAVGGDCVTCHSEDWDLIHLVAPSHAMIVTVSGTYCANCHDNTLVSTAPNTHDACTSCHTPSDGVLFSLATGVSAPGNCATCHMDTWENTHPNAPDHTALVKVGNSGCAECHDNTLISPANDTHDGCFNCHSPTDGSLVSYAIGKDFTTDGDCTTCHMDSWASTHLVAPDHSGIVTVGATTCGNCHNDNLVGERSHFACTSCHNETSGALISLAIGKTFVPGGDCTNCHMETWVDTHVTNTPDHTTLVQVAATGCGDCHADPPPLVDPNDPKNHDTCLNCHDADGGLIGLATGKTLTPAGDCSSCHMDNWEPTHSMNVPDHSSLVQTTGTDCASCHDNTLLADAGLPGADTHQGCSSCHDPVTGALKGSAIGKDFTNGGDCTTCHGVTWNMIHLPGNEPDHSNLVTTTGTGCGNCHDDSLLADAGMPGTDTHLDCSSCHNPTSGALVSHAIGKTFTAGGNCTTCHMDSWKSIHTPAPRHTSLVTVNGTTCGDCHSSPPPLVDPNDPMNHDDCFNCHDSDGALVSTAVGKTFAAGGNCSTCHMNADSSHHMSNFAQTGDCFHCHTSLAVDRPAQAACRECHGTSHNDKGGPPQDYAACAACHDTTPYHAKPPQAIGYTPTTYNGKQTGKGRFAIFWSQFTDNGQDQEGTFLENIRPNGEDMNDEGGWNWSNPSLNFDMYPITHNGQSYMVPGFSPPANQGSGNPPPPSGNLALNQPASASGDNGASYRASNAVDGNGSSYWYVDAGGWSRNDEWLKVDLGQSQNISQVVIKWHSSEYAENYEVQVSTNNYSWTRVLNAWNGNGGTDTISFSSRSARYVRVICSRERNNGYGIYELEVYQ